MRALIGSNGKVIDVVATESEQFPAPNDWVTAPEGVEIGWRYDAETGALSAPPPGESPRVERVINLRDFMDRLAPAKRQAVFVAARTDAEVAELLSRAGAAPFKLGSPETAAGIDALIGKGLLDASDKAALLA